MASDLMSLILSESSIKLGATPSNKESAIREVGELLIATGKVAPEFVESMARRESVSNTYLGHGVAIPHGMVEDKSLIYEDAIAVLQVPEGVIWSGDDRATLIVAIAAKSDNHITILRRLTRLIQDETLLEALRTTDDRHFIMNALLADTSAQHSDNAGENPLEAGVATDLAESFEWVVDYPSGLHARPSTVWADAAKNAGIKIQVRHHNELADASNMVSLLQLGLREGDTIVISAEGDEARAVLSKFKNIITGLSKEEIHDAQKAAQALLSAKHGGWKPTSDITPIVGVAASPGFAMGQIYHLETTALKVPDLPEPLPLGTEKLERALEKTTLQMRALIDDMTRRLGAKDAEIFKAQSAFLEDEALMTLACQYLVEGHGVAWAWHAAFEERATLLAGNSNPLIAARAIDLRDIGQRVLANIDPALKQNTLKDLPDGEYIIVADDLTPSDTAGLDPTRVKGLATFLGGPTSHTAILARTLGIPAVVAMGKEQIDFAKTDMLIVDGDAGRVYRNPNAENQLSAQAWMTELSDQRQKAEASRQLPATSTDGATMMIGANINRPDQVAMALSEGAEGVGLMRTEFLFLERGDAPTEEAQYETYKAMGKALEGRPLIIRTLDIGGDKQVAHLKLPHEENPFLGVRGARLLLRRLDLLLPQLRALYRAAMEVENLQIMFPMITSVSEVFALKKYCEDVRVSLKAPSVPIGIMIEVPAAALLADKLAAHVDFFSIGTNDLTQYTLAIDRQNPDLAAEANGLHPAVLNMIHQTVQGAKKFDRFVGVCGGLAGDPFGAEILMGLGIDELSMTPRDIPAVKARLRRRSMTEMQALAQQALGMESADDVESLKGETL